MEYSLKDSSHLFRECNFTSSKDVSFGAYYRHIKDTWLIWSFILGGCPTIIVFEQKHGNMIWGHSTPYCCGRTDTSKKRSSRNLQRDGSRTTRGYHHGIDTSPRRCTKRSRHGKDPGPLSGLYYRSSPRVRRLKRNPNRLPLLLLPGLSPYSSLVQHTGVKGRTVQWYLAAVEGRLPTPRTGRRRRCGESEGEFKIKSYRWRWERGSPNPHHFRRGTMTGVSSRENDEKDLGQTWRHFPEIIWEEFSEVNSRWTKD